jgi:hypothetical protein
MTFDSILSLAVSLATLAFVVVLTVRLRGRKRVDGRRVRSGPGPGAAGAVYGMLHEDKRRAIEIIVEGRAEATAPEHADGTPEAGRDGYRPRPGR